ncbi:MAG: cryptochrome/photolyase family protein [Paracoccaceae bacterium]
MINTETIYWIRRDLRLGDNPALVEAINRGGPVIPVVINDDIQCGLGAASAYRMSMGFEVMDKTLRALGSRIIYRSGDPVDVLRELVRETGAGAVYWSRLYDPESVARDTKVKATLQADGIDAKSVSGHLMFEPWTVETKAGGFFRVYTPFWRAVSGRDVATPLPAPTIIPSPAMWPQSEHLSDWKMGARLRCGQSVLSQYLSAGEGVAQDILFQFMETGVDRYATGRDLMGVNGTSRLSQFLTLGEISPRQVWHVACQALMQGAADAEAFIKQLVWREFGYHLMYHTPHITTGNWSEKWDHFPWQEDEDHPHVLAWKQGRTGIPLIDAAMREIYVTGYMHNRGRMNVGSYLTKHLLTHWRIGQKWFEECLVDWDPALNALGWQWVAGSGPDATPYFRVFNPETQAKKFDDGGAYRNTWIAEGQRNAPKTALDFYEAIPQAWNLRPDMRYPDPIVDLSTGRNRALESYKARTF